MVSFAIFFCNEITEAIVFRNISFCAVKTLNINLLFHQPRVSTLDVRVRNILLEEMISSSFNQNYFTPKGLSGGGIELSKHNPSSIPTIRKKKNLVHLLFSFLVAVKEENLMTSECHALFAFKH